MYVFYGILFSTQPQYQVGFCANFSKLIVWHGNLGQAYDAFLACVRQPGARGAGSFCSDVGNVHSGIAASD